jgi:hypothetical protein
MSIGKIEKFGLKAIADALDGSDVLTARDRLSQLVGVAVDVSGKVRRMHSICIKPINETPGD